MGPHIYSSKSMDRFQRNESIVFCTTTVSNIAPQRTKRTPCTGKFAEWQISCAANPVKAWTGGNLKIAAAAAFELRDAGFALKQPVSEADAPWLADMLQELVDYRLAAYEVRLAVAEPVNNVIPFPTKSREVVELPYFPNLKIACGHFKTGRAAPKSTGPCPWPMARWTRVATSLRGPLVTR